MKFNTPNSSSLLAYEVGRIHSFNTAAQAVKLVREGKKGFLTQYFLNPSVTQQNIWYTVTALVLIITLRFTLSAAHHPRVRHIPSVFSSLFGRFAKRKRESKLCENLWYSCWHTFSFIFGLIVLYSEGLTEENPGWIRMLIRDGDVRWYWFPTSTEYANGNMGWPLFPSSPIMQVYYLTELAFWLSCIVFLWIETIRDDFHALLLHHITTCILIGFSYICSFWRIGTVVLLTHDFADIILYSAKAIHYTRAPGGVVDFMFALFAVGFFISRLVFFPLFCVRPALDCCSVDNVDGVPISHRQVPGGIFLPGFLCVLQMLHIFWFGLIIKMIKRTFKHAPVSKEGDVRSEDDESEGIRKIGEEDGAKSDSSSSSSSVEKDQRMKLSSLPGVRATLTREELRPSPKKRDVSSDGDGLYARTARRRRGRAVQDH